MMLGLLIADKDMDSRKQMADLLIEAGYNVTVTNSAADALYGILKKTAQVVLLSGEFDDLTAVDLIPLMKKCNRDLTIILVSNEVGMGIVPENCLARAFRDLSGEANELLARAADEVYVTFSGLPLKIKG